MAESTENECDEDGKKSRKARRVCADGLHSADDGSENGSQGSQESLMWVKKHVKDSLEKHEYNVHEKYHTSGLWALIARNPIFENCTLGVITVNAIWMFIDTDYNGAPSTLQAQPIFQIAEHIFCIYFSFEWLARFMAFEKKRDGLHDAWFVFDSILVFFMVMETWVMATVLLLLGGSSGGSAMSNASILRLFRLLRLSRLARMLRSLPELMIMIKGMVASLRSVGFTLLLLFLNIYVFAILFTQLSAGTSLEDFYFGSIVGSMMTLLLSGTFLDDLTKVCTMMNEEGFYFFFLFLVFILMSALTVMNMLIGVLCDVVSAVAETEREDMDKSNFFMKMQTIVDEIDKDKSGMISLGEFHEILSEPVAVRALKDVGVDPVALVDFAEYIFEDGDGDALVNELTLKDFMDVVLQFRGTNQATMKDMIDLRRYLNDRFKTLEDRMMGLKPFRGTVSGTVSHNSEANQSLILSRQISTNSEWIGARRRPQLMQSRDIKRTTGALEAFLYSAVQELQSRVKIYDGVVSQEPQRSESNSIEVVQNPQPTCHTDIGTTQNQEGILRTEASRVSFESMDSSFSPPGVDKTSAGRFEEFADETLRECQKLRAGLPLGIASSDQHGHRKLSTESTASYSFGMTKSEPSGPIGGHSVSTLSHSNNSHPLSGRFLTPQSVTGVHPNANVVRELRLWCSRLEVSLLQARRRAHARLSIGLEPASRSNAGDLVQDLIDMLDKLRTLRTQL